MIKKTLTLIRIQLFMTQIHTVVMKRMKGLVIRSLDITVIIFLVAILTIVLIFTGDFLMVRTSTEVLLTTVLFMADILTDSVTALMDLIMAMDLIIVQNMMKLNHAQITSNLLVKLTKL